MLVNYEVCVCMCEQVRGGQGYGRKHRVKERWRAIEEEKEGGAKGRECVNSKRRQMPVRGWCLHINEFGR